MSQAIEQKLIIEVLGNSTACAPSFNLPKARPDYSVKAFGLAYEVMHQVPDHLGELEFRVLENQP